MKRQYTFTICLLFSLFFATAAVAQEKPNPMTEKKKQRNEQTTDPSDLKPVIIRGKDKSQPNPSGVLEMPDKLGDSKLPKIEVMRDEVTGLPIFIKGEVSEKSIGNKSVDEINNAAFDYLDKLKSTLHLKEPNKEFSVKNVETDRLNQTHIKLQQYYKGIEVYGGELILHTKSNGLKIGLLNGRYYPTPALESVQPSISSEKAVSLTRKQLRQITKVRDLTDQEQTILKYKNPESRLLIYHRSNHADSVALAYHITIRPNFMERWEYFIDANTGEILFYFDHTCNFHGGLYINDKKDAAHHCAIDAHIKTTESLPKPLASTKEAKLMDGPATATANDLFGITRNINVYEVGGTYFFIDGSRSMYNSSQSALPDNPVGAIWTIDGQNGSPQGNNFQVTHVTSTNNTWNNPTAVSAHYNGGKAYEYFTNTHGRNSINGSGGTIISIINITDENGNQMDNAFWNGQAIFYGNGNTAFQPLAKSLDVAGHEMSHGVVTNTANLQYNGQSGALNESFADIFGVMIDRDDWLLGDDIANTSTFPTGALRSMSDPNNGGSSLNDPGYQPKHMNSIYTGSADNGGVHINSGIPNHAFYKYAVAIGKDKAEDVFYRALTTYLTATSQFVDARVAVIQSAEDLFGASSVEVTEAGLAFDAVGIVGGSSGGGGNPGGGGSGGSIDPDNLYPINGPEFVLSDNTDFFTFHTLQVTDPQGGNQLGLSTTALGSRPSITDNGSYTVYTGTDNKMYGLQLDGTSTETVLSNNSIWSNVIISKDGNKIAAVTNNTDTSIWVYDFQAQQWGRFYLYNPTFTQGVTSGDVLYADAMEWDYSGEYIIYDALNRINTVSGTPIEYWDVGAIRIWDDSLNTFGDGTINKLFSNLPQGVSIGNPSLAKNSAFILAFDYIDVPNNDYKLIAANLVTNEIGVIYTNTDLSYPNYSTYDDQIIFNGEDFFGNDIIGVVDVQSDKITPTGTPVGIISDARWGVWFAQGLRDSTVATEPILELDAKDIPQVFPNPFSNQLTISFQNETGNDVILTIMNMEGGVVHQESLAGKKGMNIHDLNLNRFGNGVYVIHTKIGDRQFVNKIVKVE